MEITQSNKIVIYTDSQGAIGTSGNPSGKLGAYIVADIIHLIDKLQGERRLWVEIRWVPAHTSIPGTN
jgi:hypothetical protein